MATDTQTPQFSGPSTISPGSSSTGPSGTLHSDDVESGVVRSPSEPTGRIAAEARAAAEGLQRSAAHAKETLREGAAQAEVVSQRWLETSRSQVRNHPLMWVGLALAAGALIARLVR